MDDLIAQFCAVTAADPSVAEQYLAVAENNLESAVTLFLESGGASLESQQNRQTTTNEDDDELVERLQQEEYTRQAEPEIREPIRPVTERLVDPGYMPHQPLRSRVGIFNQAAPSTRGAFDEDDMDEDDFLEQTVGTSRLSAHQNRLASLFRPPFDLIRNVGLDQAREEARTAKKWIMINIQDNKEFLCQQLNRDLWSNNDVRDLVRENFLFLQFANDVPSGIEYAQYYPIFKYPHIAILDPRTGERLKVWSEVPLPEKFIEDVIDFLSRFSLDPGHMNPLAKIPRAKTNVEHMTEEEQIDLAVRQSLGRPESDESDDDFVSIGSEAEHDFDDEVEIIDHHSQMPHKKPSAEEPIEISDEEPLTEEDIFASILPEAVEEPKPDPSTTTRVQIRLGDGSRQIRSFNLNDPVRKIFAAVKHDVPELSGHFFSLTSDRRKLIDVLNETVESAGLKNSVIMVEVLD
jgi:hypothetical protein